MMEESNLTPLRELQAVLAKYDHEFDERDSIHFIAKLHEKGIIADDEWREVLLWLNHAMTYLKDEKSRENDGPLVIIDDPQS